MHLLTTPYLLWLYGCACCGYTHYGAPSMSFLTTPLRKNWLITQKPLFRMLAEMPAGGMPRASRGLGAARPAGGSACWCGAHLCTGRRGSARTACRSAEHSSSSWSAAGGTHLRAPTEAKVSQRACGGAACWLAWHACSATQQAHGAVFLQSTRAGRSVCVCVEA